MSKKGRSARASVEAEAITDPLAQLVATPPPGPEPIPGAAVALQEAIPAVESATADCDRFISFDSIRWRCACGATGRVGRTNDGIPDTSGDVLRHQPGESKE
jgi:hypothetical protein